MAGDRGLTIVERLLDLATAQENHERFIRRAIEHESAFTLWGDSGPLIAESESGDRDVYLFFSDEAYAKRALRESWPEFPNYSVREIPLFELISAWLPGLRRDGHLAGTNWTGDLIGLEIDPDVLLTELIANLPNEMAERHREKLDAIKRAR